MNAYDNATNANKTRGGLKRCQDILRAFPETLDESWEAEQIEHLIDVCIFLSDPSSRWSDFQVVVAIK
jgi:hypothetical protein